MTEPRKTSLRAGDEVELRIAEWPGVRVEGPVVADDQGCCLRVGPCILVSNGDSVLPEGAQLTVTKLAPRPFYANHEREEPVQGDVARDADTPERRTYWFDGLCWNTSDGAQDVKPLAGDNKPLGKLHLPEKLLLLVDGDTGLPVALPHPTRLADPEPIHEHGHGHRLSGMAQDPNRPGFGPPSTSPFN